MKLVLSFRWHRDYHGRAALDDPAVEWPPSPWRLFCALVSAARPPSTEAIPDCLRWLAAQPPPVIFTPPIGEETPEPKHSVPLDDIFPKEPFRDGADSRRRLYKFRQDTRMEILGSKTVRYVWALADGAPGNLVPALDDLMAKVPYLGCSTDSGSGAASLLAGAPRDSSDIEWTPNAAAGTALPCLDEAGLTRLVAFHHTGQPQGRRFREVGPRLVDYRSSRQRAPVCAVFRFQKPDGARHAWDCHRACELAEIVRGALLNAAASAGAGDVAFLHGHHDAGREHIHIAPLPSIGHEHADARIRRVLLHGSPAADEMRSVGLAIRQLHWFTHEREGIVFKPEGASAGVARCYLAEDCEWSTVTPVVLPHPELRGRDGELWRSRSSADAAARLALRQKIEDRRFRIVARLFEAAGYFPADLEISLWPAHRALPAAAKFAIPVGRRKYLAHTRCHVTARFREPIRGPLLIGPGRFFGLGLFAPTRALDCGSGAEAALAAVDDERVARRPATADAAIL